MCLQYKSFESTVEKGEIACNKQFLLFPQFFLLIGELLPFSSNLKPSPENSYSLEESKNWMFGKELKNSSNIEYISKTKRKSHK